MLRNLINEGHATSEERSVTRLCPMGIHFGRTAHLLVLAFLLLLASPGSAVNTRLDSQQLRGTDILRSSDQQVWTGPRRPEDQPKTKAADEDSGDDDDDDSDEDDESGKADKDADKSDKADKADKEDDESDKDNAADKARQTKEAKLKRNVEEAKFALDENLQEQDEISMAFKGFDNIDQGQAIIDMSAKAVANETQSASLGGYLGDMWKEMQMFSSPFYEEHLMESRVHGKKKEKVLRKQYKAEQRTLKRQKLEWASEDAKDENRVAKEQTKKAEPDEPRVAEKIKDQEIAPVVRGRHKPMFTKKTMPKVSPTVECVMILAWQFFIVYTAVALLRTVNQVSQNRFASCMRAQELVEMVCPYVMFAPMLCVLFLATRMRAIQLSQGDTEKHKLPQPWVQFAMYAASYGVVFQVIVKLVLLLLRPQSRAVNIFFSIAKYFFMACIYGGFTVVCVGAYVMPAPKELWGDGPPPEVSAALGCTMMLTTTFFVIYLGLSLFRTVEELRPSLLNKINTLVKVQLLFWRARHSVNLAPMLCILFIVARMRALQMDPKNGNPPSWAQQAMYLCSGAIVVQVVASIALPLIDKDAHTRPGPVQGQIILVMSTSALRIVGDLMRYIPLLCVYGGAAAVAVSLFVMEAPGGQAAPKISVTTSCVVALSSLYLLVFAVVFIAQTVVERLPVSRASNQVITVLDAGQRTVMFAPMLCLLFIATRMRALQLTRTTDGKSPPGAGPQKWVQDGMYLATGSVILQVLIAYLTTAFLGPGFSVADEIPEDKDELHAPRSTDNIAADSEPTDKRSISAHWAVGASLNVVKSLCLFAMYGGAVTVMVGIVSMTPETLPPYHEAHGVIERIAEMF